MMTKAANYWWLYDNISANIYIHISLYVLYMDDTDHYCSKTSVPIHLSIYISKNHVTSPWLITISLIFQIFRHETTISVDCLVHSSVCMWQLDTSKRQLLLLGSLVLSLDAEQIQSKSDFSPTPKFCPSQRDVAMIKGPSRFCLR